MDGENIMKRFRLLKFTAGACIIAISFVAGRISRSIGNMRILIESANTTNLSYPTISGSEDYRARFVGTWMLTDDSLDQLRTLPIARSGESRIRLQKQEILSTNHLIMLSGVKLPLASANAEYIGIANTLPYRIGQPIIPEVYAIPGRPSPQSGLDAELFSWFVVNKIPTETMPTDESAVITMTKTWLIVCHEDRPDFWKKEAYAVLERDGKLILRKSIFAGDGSAKSILEWRKVSGR